MIQPKGTDWLNGYKNKTPLFALYKRPTSDLGTYTEWKLGLQKILYANGNQKKVRVALLISDIRDSKIKTTKDTT